MHKIRFALLHLHFLLAEGHEEVLHEPPVQKGAVLIDPRHAEHGKVAHAAQGCFEGAYQALALVEVDEDVDLRAGPHVAGDVGLGQENFAHFAAVHVGAVVGEACEGECVVVAKFNHAGQG